MRQQREKRGQGIHERRGLGPQRGDRKQTWKGAIGKDKDPEKTLKMEMSRVEAERRVMEKTNRNGRLTRAQRKVSEKTNVMNEYIPAGMAELPVTNVPSIFEFSSVAAASHFFLPFSPRATAPVTAYYRYCKTKRRRCRRLLLHMLGCGLT